MQEEVWFIFDAESDIQSKPMTVGQVLAHIINLKTSKKKNIYLWKPGWPDWMSLKDFIASQNSNSIGLQPPTPSVTFNKSFDQDHASLNPMKLSETIVPSIDTINTSESKVINLEKKIDNPYTEVSIAVNSTLSRDFNGSELSLEKIKKVKIDFSTRQKLSGKEQDTKEAQIQPEERRKHPRHNFKIEIILMASFGSFRTHSHDISLSGTQLVDKIPAEFLDQPFDVIIVNPFETNPAIARLILPVKLVGNPSDLWRLQFANQNQNQVSKLSALLNAYIAHQSKINQKSG